MIRNQVDVGIAWHITSKLSSVANNIILVKNKWRALQPRWPQFLEIDPNIDRHIFSPPPMHHWLSTGKCRWQCISQLLAMYNEVIVDLQNVYAWVLNVNSWLNMFFALWMSHPWIERVTHLARAGYRKSWTRSCRRVDVIRTGIIQTPDKSISAIFWCKTCSFMWDADTDDTGPLWATWIILVKQPISPRS